jgi:hypothetical protein
MGHQQQSKLKTSHNSDKAGRLLAYESTQAHQMQLTSKMSWSAQQEFKARHVSFEVVLWLSQLLEEYG